MSVPAYTTYPVLGNPARTIHEKTVEALMVARVFLGDIVCDYKNLALTMEDLQLAFNEIMEIGNSMESTEKWDFAGLLAKTSLQSIFTTVTANLFRLQPYKRRSNLQLQVGATLQKKLTELGYGYEGRKYVERGQRFDKVGSPWNAFILHTLCYVRAGITRDFQNHQKVPNVQANVWLSVFFAKKRAPGDFDELVKKKEKSSSVKKRDFHYTDILLTHLAQHSQHLGHLADLLRQPRMHGFSFHPDGKALKILKSGPLEGNRKKNKRMSTGSRKDEKESFAENLAEAQDFLSDSGQGGARDMVTMEVETKWQELIVKLPEGPFQFLDIASLEALQPIPNKVCCLKDDMTIVGADNGVGNIMVARSDDTPGRGKSVKVDLTKFNKVSLGTTPSSQAKGQKKNKGIPERCDAALTRVKDKLATPGQTMMVFKGDAWTNKSTRNNRGIGGYSHPDEFWNRAEKAEGIKHIGVPEGFTSQLACYAGDNGTDTFASMVSPCTLYLQLRKSDDFRKNVNKLAVTITDPQSPPSDEYMRASAFNSLDASNSENGVSAEVLFLAGARGHAVEHCVFEHIKNSLEDGFSITKGKFVYQKDLKLCGTPDAFLRYPDQDVVLLEMKSVMSKINDNKILRWALQVHVYLTLHPEAKSARIIVKQFPPYTPHCSPKWIIIRVDRVDTVNSVMKHSSTMRPAERVQHILDKVGYSVWCGLKDVSNDENDTTARVMALRFNVRRLKATIGTTLAKAVKECPTMKPIFNLSDKVDFLFRSFYYMKRGIKSVDLSGAVSKDDETGKFEPSQLGRGKRFVDRDGVAATSISRTGMYLVKNENDFVSVKLTINGHQEKKVGALVRTPIAHAAKTHFDLPMDRFEKGNADRVKGAVIYSMTKALTDASNYNQRPKLAKSLKKGQFTLSVTVNGTQIDSSAEGAPEVQEDYMQTESDTDSDGGWTPGGFERVRKKERRVQKTAVLTSEQKEERKTKKEAKKADKVASVRYKLIRGMYNVEIPSAVGDYERPQSTSSRPSRNGSRKNYSQLNDEATDSPAGDTSRKSSPETSRKSSRKSSDKVLKRGNSSMKEHDQRNNQALLDHRLNLSMSKEDGNQAHLKTLTDNLAKDTARKWTIIDVTGDGNCQFRATSVAIYGNEGNHASVRAEAVHTMTKMKSDFEPFMHDHRLNSSESAPNFAQYTDEMAVSGVWGDHLTLVAISFAYQRPVMVISNQENSRALLLRDGGEEQIHLENLSVPDNAIVLGYLDNGGSEHYVFLGQENQ